MSDTKPKHPCIGMCPCESSQVKSHGYDAATRTLAVEFKSGVVYHYHDVPATTYDDMKAAKSVGSFIGKSIKGVHKYVRIEAERA